MVIKLRREVLKSEKGQICNNKKSVMEKIERDRESLYRKWKEPQGKIPSMSLLIFLKRLNKRNIFCNASSSFHIFVFCFSYFVFLYFLFSSSHIFEAELNKRNISCQVYSSSLLISNVI